MAKGGDEHMSRLSKKWIKDLDVKVMSYVTLIVAMIAVIAATVAWFVYYRVVAATDINIVTADCDSIRVEVKQGENAEGPVFVELTQENESTIIADLDMPLFDNVATYQISSGEEGTKTVNKLVPGVYGSMTFRLTALNKVINHYRLTPETIFQYVDGVQVLLEGDVPSLIQTDPNVIMLQALSKGHILFFGSRVERTRDENGSLDSEITIDGNAESVAEYTHNSRYVFCNPIEPGSCLEGDLTWNESTGEGEPTEVTLYWYWPYEYANLSNEIKTAIALPVLSGDLSGLISEDRKLYFDKDKMQEIINKTSTYNETQLYDYADTRIGTYVKGMRLQVEVVGSHVKPETP